MKSLLGIQERKEKQNKMFIEEFMIWKKKKSRTLDEEQAYIEGAIASERAQILSGSRKTD
jgi:hypothetical protein